MKRLWTWNPWEYGLHDLMRRRGRKHTWMRRENAKDCRPRWLKVAHLPRPTTYCVFRQHSDWERYYWPVITFFESTCLMMFCSDQRLTYLCLNGVKQTSIKLFWTPNRNCSTSRRPVLPAVMPTACDGVWRSTWGVRNNTKQPTDLSAKFVNDNVDRQTPVDEVRSVLHDVPMVWHPLRWWNRAKKNQ